jgi:hypothetical protein
MIMINGNNNVADFVIANGAAVMLNGVTITGGSTASNGDGGGIYNSGRLTLSNSTVAGNTANGGDGIIMITDYWLSPTLPSSTIPQAWATIYATTVGA